MWLRMGLGLSFRSVFLVRAPEEEEDWSDEGDADEDDDGEEDEEDDGDDEGEMNKKAEDEDDK